MPLLDGFCRLKVRPYVGKPMLSLPAGVPLSLQCLAAQSCIKKKRSCFYTMYIEYEKNDTFLSIETNIGPFILIRFYFVMDSAKFKY